jgi:hypothetical protein
MLLARRLGDGWHKSRAAPLRDVGEFVRDQPQRLRRIGRMAAAKRNRFAIGERVGVLVRSNPLCHRPAIHTHARWVDAGQCMQQRSRRVW